MNIIKARKAISYWLFAGHRKGHGIHSPYIFEVVSKVFQNKIDESVVKGIEKIRKDLMRDRRLVAITDLGSGSLKIAGNVRRVSDIASFSPVTSKYGKLLASFAIWIKGRPVVELGTSLGISTLYMAKAAPGSQIFTIEGCPVISRLAAENFRIAGAGNIRQYTGDFGELLDKVISDAGDPALVFVDGNHSKEPLLGYVTGLLKILPGDAVIIIDDISLSTEMNEAWKELRSLPGVKASIDIMQMGILFLREGLTGGDHRVRY